MTLEVALVAGVVPREVVDSLLRLEVPVRDGEAVAAVAVVEEDGRAVAVGEVVVLRVAEVAPEVAVDSEA